jgi:hypothetical protein
MPDSGTYRVYTYHILGANMARGKRKATGQHIHPVKWSDPDWKRLTDTAAVLRSEHPGAAFNVTDVIRMAVTEFCERKLTGEPVAA